MDKRNFSNLLIIWYSLDLQVWKHYLKFASTKLKIQSWVFTICLALYSLYSQKNHWFRPRMETKPRLYNLLSWHGDQWLVVYRGPPGFPLFHGQRLEVVLYGVRQLGTLLFVNKDFAIPQTVVTVLTLSPKQLKWLWNRFQVWTRDEGASVGTFPWAMSLTLPVLGRPGLKPVVK